MRPLLQKITSFLLGTSRYTLSLLATTAIFASGSFFYGKIFPTRVAEPPAQESPWESPQESNRSPASLGNPRLATSGTAPRGRPTGRDSEPASSPILRDDRGESRASGNTVFDPQTFAESSSSGLAMDQPVAAETVKLPAKSLVESSAEGTTGSGSAAIQLGGFETNTSTSTDTSTATDTSTSTGDGTLVWGSSNWDSGTWGP